MVGRCPLTSPPQPAPVCVLWVWCHQCRGDICPLVTFSPWPDGAKSLLAPCWSQLRHGMGMPTQWLILKPGWLRGHVRGLGRQEGAGRGLLCPCFRELCTFLHPGRF